MVGARRPPRPRVRRTSMPRSLCRLVLLLATLALPTGIASAQPRVTLAVGGGSCLCYLPTMLAKQLGEYEKAGVNVDIVDFKGGSESLKAVIGGSADVVSGYFDHCVNLAARGQHLQSFVVYDRFPGLVLVVSPRHTSEIKSVKDLVNKKVGVSAPGSSTDFFLKYLLSKNGVDPNAVGVIGVGLGATAVAAMEQGQIDAAVMLDPAVTILAGKYKDLRILSDTRSQKDTLAVFGGEYPGGALYTRAEWIASHEKEVQAMTNAILATLKWIHSHTPEEIADKMPENLVGKDKATYVAALKNMMPMYSENGRMDPKGAQAVLAVFSQSSPEVPKAHIDLSQTYTNKYVDAALKSMGMKEPARSPRILAARRRSARDGRPAGALGIATGASADDDDGGTDDPSARSAGACLRAAALAFRRGTSARDRRLFRRPQARSAVAVERPRAAAARTGHRREGVPRRLSRNRLCELRRLARLGAARGRRVRLFRRRRRRRRRRRGAARSDGRAHRQCGPDLFSLRDARSGRHRRRQGRSRRESYARAQGGDRS